MLVSSKRWFLNVLHLIANIGRICFEPRRWSNEIDGVVLRESHNSIFYSTIVLISIASLCALKVCAYCATFISNVSIVCNVQQAPDYQISYSPQFWIQSLTHLIQAVMRRLIKHVNINKKRTHVHFFHSFYLLLFLIFFYMNEKKNDLFFFWYQIYI